MASEDQVMELMMLIDLGLTQAIGIEERLDDYASKLQVCRTSNYINPFC